MRRWILPLLGLVALLPGCGQAPAASLPAEPSAESQVQATAPPAPTAAPTAPPTAAPTAPPTASPTAAPTAPPTATPAPATPPRATSQPAIELALATPRPTKAPPAAAPTQAGPGAVAPPTVSPATRQVAQVQVALADLAGRLQVDPQTIDVVRVEEVEWPDGSVGCPRDDMAYTQALVNGMFIQLRAGGQSYNYHSGGRIQPFLCTSPNEVLPEDLPPELRGG